MTASSSTRPPHGDRLPRCIGRWAAMLWLGGAALALAADDVAKDGVSTGVPGVLDDVFEPEIDLPAEDPPAAPDPPRHPPVRRLPVTHAYRSLPAGPRHAEEARAAIEAALDRDVGERWQFRERSLTDVAVALADDLRVPVILDRDALEDDGIDPELTILFQSHGMSGRGALRLLLQPLGLSWSIAGEALVLTTHDAVRGTMITRVYPLPFGHGRRGVDGVARLAETVLATIATETWDIHGGPASLQTLEEAGEPLLVVSQSREVHEEIEALFATLHRRGLAEFEPAAGGGPPAPSVRILRVGDARIRADLAAKLVGLCNASLTDGGDPRAQVEQVGECLAIRSNSPDFHVLAEQIVDAVAGIADPGRQPALPPGIGGPF